MGAWVAVAIGGAIGSVARHGLNQAADRIALTIFNPRDATVVSSAQAVKDSVKTAQTVTRRIVFDPVRYSGVTLLTRYNPVHVWELWFHNGPHVQAVSPTLSQ